MYYMHFCAKKLYVGFFSGLLLQEIKRLQAIVSKRIAFKQPSNRRRMLH